jgi:hypothetical protein
MTSLALEAGKLDRVSHRLLFIASLAALAALLAVGLAAMLDPPVDSREAVDVPFDPDGPVAQPFRVGELSGWLVRLPGEELRAFSARSPHRGCYIDFRSRADFEGSGFEIPDDQPGLFRDVCFGSTFLLTGDRIFGPSPRGMDAFEVRATRAASVVIDASRVQNGRCGKGATPPYMFGCSEPDHPRYSRPRPPETISPWAQP